MKNKIEIVLKELQPIADALGIDIDYVITDAREYLVCNGQRICTNGTSVCGIKQEFIGYVFLKVWRGRSLGWFDTQTRNYIRQYWYDDEFRQPYYKNY